jgi:hypothetical protein
MSNLSDRNAARYTTFDDPGPQYPNLGATVAKHRRLKDDTPEGRKAYGQAVHTAIRALQRRELFSAAYDRASLPRDTGAMSDAAFMAMLRNQANKLRNVPSEPKSEEDYYRAMLKSRGVDPRKIEDLVGPGHAAYRQPLLWLKAAWNVIKTKRGTPYLAEAKAEPAAQPEAPAPQPKKRGWSEPADAETYIKRLRNPDKRAYARLYARHLRHNAVGDGPDHKSHNISYMAAQAVRMDLAKLVKPIEADPKPSKPRVPSHYLSSASPVAYHAAM